MLDEALIHTQAFDLAADSARPVGLLVHRLAAAPRQIRLTLSHGQTVIVQNSYDLSWFDEAGGGFYQQFKRWVADWVLR